MTELTITNFNGVETIDSRLIAENIGKPHNDLMKDIRRYSGFLTEGKISLSDFFIKSTYQDCTGRTLPCYLCTRKGCEMIANKMTGQKGTIFTAMYINAFHSMEQTIKRQNAPLDSDKKKALELKEMNARVRMSNQFLKLAKISASLSEKYKDILVAKSAEILAGEPIIPLPKSTRKTYSASEIAKMFGVSPQKIGRIANEHGLKTEEFGEWYRDKSPYSSKEVDTFRYYDSAVERFKELIKN